jgi:hypothetical protein
MAADFAAAARGTPRGMTPMGPMGRTPGSMTRPPGTPAHLLRPLGDPPSPGAAPQPTPRGRPPLRDPTPDAIRRWLERRDLA